MRFYLGLYFSHVELNKAQKRWKKGINSIFPLFGSLNSENWQNDG